MIPEAKHHSTPECGLSWRQWSACSSERSSSSSLAAHQECTDKTTSRPSKKLDMPTAPKHEKDTFGNAEPPDTRCFVASRGRGGIIWTISTLHLNFQYGKGIRRWPCIMKHDWCWLGAGMRAFTIPQGLSFLLNSLFTAMIPNELSYKQNIALRCERKKPSKTLKLINNLWASNSLRFAEQWTCLSLSTKFNQYPWNMIGKVLAVYRSSSPATSSF